MENVILPTREGVEPHSLQWAQMPPALGLGPVAAALIQLIFNGNNAGDQLHTNFYQPDVKRLFMEYFLSPSLRQFLDNTYHEDQILNWLNTLQEIVPALANQLVRISPVILNSVKDQSYVSGVTFQGMRGGDMMVSVETFSTRVTFNGKPLPHSGQDPIGFGQGH